ncbi:MAG TPA: fibronectin type III domain-containing protein, partial [Candidatus Saccharimonadales bacterium]|nr:fibronectin type III domain-containing protein [Candidatus Saccharimonadales bacterium]
MHVRPYPSSATRRQRLLAALASSSAALLISSCASPGVPQPPSLHLPRVVTDLTAQRTGPNVHLHWTTPDRTTDGMAVPSSLTAEVCREENALMGNSAHTKAAKTARKNGGVAAPQAVSGCDVVLRLTVKPGATDADDPLPAALAADPVRPLGYRVRILNPKGRSAGLSLSAFAAAGDAPAPVMGLHATAERDGALLQWQAVDGDVLVELDRTLVTSPAAKRSGKRSGLDLSEEEPVEIRLRTGREDAPAKDPGGTVDRTAVRGRQYSYRAQRIRVVEMAGNRLELRSTISATAGLTMKDRFAPSAPTGLASIPATSNGRPAIDLSWQAGTENDLAGYNVYRRTGSSGPFTRMTSKPAAGPAFSDTAVDPAVTYTYRVTAVDNDGNESSP